MEWQPQQGPLGQLTQCLKDSLSGYDVNAQKNAEEVSSFSLVALGRNCALRRLLWKLG